MRQIIPLDDYQYKGAVQYCATEVERQGDGPMAVAHMFDAWIYAKDVLGPQEIMPNEAQIMTLSMFIRNLGEVRRYRNTPVTFQNGGSAANAEHIPRLMEAWVMEAQDIHSLVPIDHLMKVFLDIHPFEDGNGRVASLLWNLGSGLIFDPQPMPYLYGEGD